MTRKLVFIDTESTGLDSANDDLTEFAYAIEDQPIQNLYFGVTEVSDFIDSLTKFRERGIGKIPRSPVEEFNEFYESCKDATMVAANPAHDKSFLAENNLFPFHYRMLDIQSYAMGVLRLDYMPGMEDIYKELQARGINISRPDHSAAGDVAALRDAYVVLSKGDWS